VGRETYKNLPTNMIGHSDSAVSTRPVALEVPLALTYNGIAHVVMMVTPENLKDFSIGFSFSEGIIESLDDIEELTIRGEEGSFIADIWISKTLHAKLLKKRRNLVGQTGCGVCGVAELADLKRVYPTVSNPPSYTKAQLFSALTDLPKHQSINAATGAVHGAAFLDENGAIVAMREDVGRHNALDKLIGHLKQSDLPHANGSIFLTSRCSFELVQKVIAAAVPMLVTVSAPTTLAVSISKEHDLTLICLARSDEMLAFNDPYGVLEKL